mmetsp:Transcript_35621/g.65249  ORF Transcript_35621/g.65249 Transcript_35621/m.65249 type:complete len:531 (-) Transcript_35621:52-1644(-)
MCNSATAGKLDLKCNSLRKLRKASVEFVRAACPDALQISKAAEQRKAQKEELRSQRKRRLEADRKLKETCQLRSGRLGQLMLAAANDEQALPALKRLRVPDGPAQVTAPMLLEDAQHQGDESRRFNVPHRCYTCKCMYTMVHHFYSDLCPSCAALNFAKRHLHVDMTGRVCLVTGARVKIGFHVALKLLRMGARVIATTRFPSNALKLFQKEHDSQNWLPRLQVIGLDFRYVEAVQQFCSWMLEKEPHLDVVINNAAQTIRRPAAYYTHLLQAEVVRTAPSSIQDGASPEAEASSAALVQRPFVFRAGRPLTSAEASQVAVLPEDELEGELHFPKGVVDAQGQQLDLRTTNSWKQKLEEVSCPEMLEVLCINVVAPFLINSKLLPLLRRSPHADRYIVNVSAMEGKFNRRKTACHPHTNMAKAALNMMTRTSASDLAKNGNIFVTSVDTGWINDESPYTEAVKRAQDGFQTPLDEIDAAARVLDPIVAGVAFTSAGKAFPRIKHHQEGQGDPELGPMWGVFLKDYAPTDW